MRKARVRVAMQTHDCKRHRHQEWLRFLRLIDQALRPKSNFICSWIITPLTSTSGESRLTNLGMTTHYSGIYVSGDGVATVDDLTINSDTTAIYVVSGTLSILSGDYSSAGTALYCEGGAVTIPEGHFETPSGGCFDVQAPGSIGLAAGSWATPAQSAWPTATEVTVAIGSPLSFTDNVAYDIPASTVGTAIANIDVSGGASGGTAPYSFSAVGLPAGITISAAGVISGTPTAAGAAGTATITVTDATSATASITIAYGIISPPVTTSTLGGTVTISGAAIFGQTLTAVTSGLTSMPSVALGTLSYQWKRGGADIGGATNATYTTLAADVGQTLSVTVTAANCSGSVTSTATGAIGKATNPAAVPTLSYTISDTFPKTVTITAVDGAQYSFDGGASWGSENTYTSNAAEDVTLAIRWAETGVYSASGETSIEINTAEDPNADIAEARAAIGFADDAGEFRGAQEAIADEAAALLDIEAIIQMVLENWGLGSVDFAITNGVFQAASGGVNGRYTFTVTFTKGGGVPRALDLDYVIVATPVPPEVGEPVIVAVSEALLPEHRSPAQQVLDTIRGVTPPPPGAINAVIVGCDVTFEVSAVGEGLVYQWFKNGAAVPGANAAIFTALAVQEGEVYAVSVTNAAGGVTVREVASPEFFHPVVIVSEPAPTVALQAGVATLSVTVNGSGTIYYQWCRVDMATGALDPIPLANTATYNATAPGFYCLVTNNRANHPATSGVVEVVP
ncbi:MAG: hypothetical protein LBD14_06005 [Puniceicoccales bacterium]|nr:hypothetical protein [Puniceicoccales bacterium]